MSEDGRDIPGTTHVESTVFEGQLHTKWGDGTTGDSPDRVFGIQGSDGKQVQSSAADGNLVSVEGKFGYLVIDPVTGKYTYTLYNGEDGKPVGSRAWQTAETVTEDFTLMLNGQVVKKYRRQRRENRDHHSWHERCAGHHRRRWTRPSMKQATTVFPVP